MTPEHEQHFYSQKSIFYRKFAKDTIFPAQITFEFNTTPPNWPMITELFLTKPRNSRVKINNENASASNVNIRQNSLTTQVEEVPESLTSNLGNENVET